MDDRCKRHCQCCFSENCLKDLYTEYNWMDKKEIYGEMLISIFGIKVSTALIILL